MYVGELVFFFSAGGSWADRWRPLVWWRRSHRLSLSRLAAWQGDVAQVEDGKWMSFRVENPALQGQQVVAGEQQVQIPEGDGVLGGEVTRGRGRQGLGKVGEEQEERREWRSERKPTFIHAHRCEWIFVHSET